MTEHHDHESDELSTLGTMLHELGVPDRMINDADSMVSAIIGFQANARERFGPTAGVMLQTLSQIPILLERIDDNIADLQSIETTLMRRIDAVQADLTARIAALQEQMPPARLRVGNR